MPRLLWRSWGGGAISFERGTPVQGLLANVKEKPLFEWCTFPLSMFCSNTTSVGWIYGDCVDGSNSLLQNGNIGLVAAEGTHSHFNEAGTEPLHPYTLKVLRQ